MLRPGTRYQVPVGIRHQGISRHQAPGSRHQASGISQKVRTGHTGDRRAETGDRRPETGDRRPETGDRRPETGDRRPETGDRRPETGDRRPETGDIFFSPTYFAFRPSGIGRASPSRTAVRQHRITCGLDSSNGLFLPPEGEYPERGGGRQISRTRRKDWRGGVWGFVGTKVF